MQSNDFGEPRIKRPEQEQQEKTLRWLLEQDMSEPEDSLFELCQGVELSAELTPLESAVAERPMFSRKSDAEALTGFLAEEIVLGGVGDASDIYGESAAQDNAEGNDSLNAMDMVIALEHPRSDVDNELEASPVVEDGSDILGLLDDDDIGSRPLAIRRVKKAALAASPQRSSDIAQGQSLHAPYPAVPPDGLDLDTADQVSELSDAEHSSVEEAPGDIESEDTGVGSELTTGDESIVFESEIASGEGILEAFDGDLSDFDRELKAFDADPSRACDDVEFDAGFELDKGFEPDTGFELGAGLEFEAGPWHETGPELETESELEAGLELEADNFALGDEEPASGEIEVADSHGDAQVFAEQLEQLEQLSDVDEGLWAVEESASALVGESGGPDPEPGDLLIPQAAAHDISNDSSSGHAIDDVADCREAESVTELPGCSERSTQDADAVTGQESSLRRYVNETPAPAEDEAFDEYLLAGAALDDSGFKLDEFALEATAGAVALDVNIDEPLDYHEDFVLPDGLPEDVQLALEQARSEAEKEAASLQRPGLPAITSSGSAEPDSSGGTDADFSRFGAAANESDERLFSDTDTDTDTDADADADAGQSGAIFDAPPGAASLNVSATPLALEAPPAPQMQLAPEAPLVPEAQAESPAVEDFELDVLGTEDELGDWEFSASSADEEDLNALLESFGPGQESVDEHLLTLEEADFEVGGLGEQEQLDSPEISADSGAYATSPENSGVFASEPEEEKEPSRAAAPVQPMPEGIIPDGIRFSTASNSPSEVFTEFLQAFLEEAAAELEKLEEAIGHWEQEPQGSYGSHQVPRVLHTLKGIAKGVGLQRYGTLVHNFETLIQGLPAPAPKNSQAFFVVINAWLDALQAGFEHIQRSHGDVTSELPVAVASIIPSSIESNPLPVKEAGASDGLALYQDKQLADEGIKTLASHQTIRMSSESLDHLLSLGNQIQQLGVRTAQATVRSKRAAVELQARLSSVRSHISKIADRALQSVTATGVRSSTELDALEMDQYSDLQEAANILREGIEDLDDLIRITSRQTGAAEALLKQQASVITALNGSLRDARVLPVSRLMPGLRRLVRNVSADLGKQVNFEVRSEAGKLDRDSHVCCQIILEHMVRNAIDHGIESAEERRAAGKSASGLISINVQKDGADYRIRLSDDGRGMDPEALRETALVRGLGLNVTELGDREALRLIFHKGFSTAKTISEISGRGVGMDVVLSELQRIGGEIEVESQVGVGTTFEVRVPSNVNVNGALLVSAAKTDYAIPLDGLIGTERIGLDEFYEAIDKGSRLRIYGLDCEPAYLATLCAGASMPDRKTWAGRSIPVIVAGQGNQHMAIAVDDVTQALELVIRSLGPQFTTVPGLAGGATTADGQAIVALDLNALVASSSDSGRSAIALEKEREERLLVLVVDDSRTQRMVATSQFDTIGVETVTAENGLVAIDLLNSTHRLPDIVLLDVEMPVKDGIQTLREIRRSARYRDIPVIMVTSRTGPKHRALAQEAGCNAYMGKPFNFPVLVEQIAQLTGQPLSIE